MMVRCKAILEYDGSFFLGSYSNKNGNSVQEALEGAIFKVFNRVTNTVFASRTDSGVHAFCQTVHFDLESKEGHPMQEGKIKMAVNFYLQGKHISIIKLEFVESDFHARFDAKLKTYMYVILNADYYSPIRKNYIYHFYKKLDLIPMQEAIQFLIGMHDYTSFTNSKCEQVNKVRLINNILIKKYDEEIRIYFSAKSFLYKQIRIMVGTLCNVGSGITHPESIHNILLKKHRIHAGFTAPACGLFLQKIVY